MGIADWYWKKFFPVPSPFSRELIMPIEFIGAIRTTPVSEMSSIPGTLNGDIIDKD